MGNEVSTLFVTLFANEVSTLFVTLFANEVSTLFVTLFANEVSTWFVHYWKLAEWIKLYISYIILFSFHNIDAKGSLNDMPY